MCFAYTILHLSLFVFFMTLPLIEDLLTRHKMLAADFLESNYDEVNAFYLQQTNAIFLNEKIMKEFVELFMFKTECIRGKKLVTGNKWIAIINIFQVFVLYEKLLHSDNYVTRRQSLKLLGELLLGKKKRKWPPW